MKVITLTQPWATLMEIGVKRIETRSWKTPYRGPLLIHAAKGFPRECKDLCYEEPFVHDLRSRGFDLPTELPRGVIIARVELLGCVSMKWLLEDHGDKASRLRTEYLGDSSNEETYGDYSEGRFAWITRGRVVLPPVVARGALGLWDFPDDQVPAVAAFEKASG